MNRTNLSFLEQLTYVEHFQIFDFFVSIPESNN